MGINSFKLGKELSAEKDAIEKTLQNPIDERTYSKELFLMGREQALFDMGKIVETQRVYLETGYTGNIKNSANYLRGYKRGIEIARTPFLPDEYKTNKKKL